MNSAADSRMGRWRGWLWWAIPFAALALMLGIETDWGRSLHRLPEPLPPIEPRPVTAALLPEYTIDGGLPGHTESVNRTLFNPTRRPAPVVVAEAARPRMNKGQFVLTGTAVAGAQHLAFLKEVSGGKSRVVRQGDQLNGALVAEIKAGRVKLTLADDFEELVLKALPGPKTTTQPAPVAQSNPSGVPLPSGGMPGAAPPAAGAAADSPGAQDATVPNRRPQPTPPTATVPAAAVPAAAAAAPVVAAPAPVAGQGTAASPDPSWNEVFERMRQRSPQPTK